MTESDVDVRTYRRWLACAVAVAALYYIVGLWWGMPNGNRTWAADSVAPMTPYAVAYHVFVGEGFNSGYFYFKYPVGHQLLLAAVGAPVLLWARLSGNLTRISTDYPFGMRDPEPVLAALGVSMRLLSVAMAIALVLLVAELARRFGGRRAGIFAAFAMLGCYPLVFYAHTSNVEVPYLFWAFVGLYATVRALEDRTPRWFLLVGAAAAMGVSTKEQIAGFFVLLPILIVVLHLRDARDSSGLGRLLPRGALVGAAVSFLTYALVNAAFFNPSGVVNRIRFLTHTLPPDAREKYAPYEFPIDVTGDWGIADEVRHVSEAVRVVGASLGWPALVVAVLALVWLVAQRSRAAAYVLAPLLGYYAVSVRLLKQVEIRYLLPISLLLVIPLAIALARMAGGRRVYAAAAGALVLGGLVYGGEVPRLLVKDARYRAEAWMEPRLARGARVEVYQSWTYLPRWSRTQGVRKPRLEEITVDGFANRKPDYVVLSSKGMEGITMYPNPDWRDGRGMMLESAERRRFVDALLSGELGYEPVARFETRMWIPRLLITSLNPAITVYGRPHNAQSDAHDDGAPKPS